MKLPVNSYIRSLKPWAVLRVHQPHCIVIQRFPNRSDADGFLAVMQRINPGTLYRIGYEPPGGVGDASD